MPPFSRSAEIIPGHVYKGTDRLVWQAINIGAVHQQIEGIESAVGFEFRGSIQPCLGVAVIQQPGKTRPGFGQHFLAWSKINSPGRAGQLAGRGQAIPQPVVAMHAFH